MSTQTSAKENMIFDEDISANLRDEIKDLFTIAQIESPRQLPQDTIYFIGKLQIQDNEAVYDLIAGRWRKYNYTPLLCTYKGQIELIAQPILKSSAPSSPWLSLGLAIATILSVWFMGTIAECQCIPVKPMDWLSGLPMLLTLMIIFIAHDFGHYFAARYHGMTISLPHYFPLPIITVMGTLGAVLRLHSPFRTRKQLFDVGAAGPLAGLLFSIPLVLWGISNSPINKLSRNTASVLEGNSIFYLGMKYLVHGQLLPNFDHYADLPFFHEALLLIIGIIPDGGGIDLLIDSMTLAAWWGLYINALSLLPIGQLDGGHIMYSLIGEKSRYIGVAVPSFMLFAGCFLWTGWITSALVWFFLIFGVFGLNHPPPVNDLVPLNSTRKALAYVMIFIFIIVFVPAPLQVL